MSTSDYEPELARLLDASRRISERFGYEIEFVSALEDCVEVLKSVRLKSLNHLVSVLTPPAPASPGTPGGPAPLPLERVANEIATEFRGYE